jgi:DNA-binding transcriptional LysR family regulator
MEIRSLDHFLSVVETGSLRSAAERIGLTQPALTKTIRRLEDGFGVTLFDRDSRGVTPTIYGEALSRHARDIHACMQAAVAEIGALRRGKTGIVRIGVGPSWQGAILPAAVGRLVRERPGIEVDIKGGPEAYLKGLLKDGMADFVLAAVPATPEPEPELEWRALLEDEYVVIADRNHPLADEPALSLEQILAYPWVLGKSSNMLNRLDFFLRTKKLALPRVAIETDILDVKFAVMQNSQYLSLHARSYLQARLPEFMCILPVTEMKLVRHGGMLTRRGVSRSPAGQAFLDYILEACEEHAAPAASAS